MKTIKLIAVIIVAGMMFSCVAAIIKAPQTASNYHPSVSCSMVQGKDGRGLTTTVDCN
jgi:hypothetical protein